MAREILWWKIKREDLIIHMASTEKGAARVHLSLSDPEPVPFDFQDLFPNMICIKDRAMNMGVIESIGKALAGDPVDFKNLPLDIKGTVFQRMAWTQISVIPFGETKTYGEVAAMLGMPRAARAVGQAMKRNPLPLLFPCHRVVASNGLGGFGGGIALKKFLINREKI